MLITASSSRSVPAEGGLLLGECRLLRSSPRAVPRLPCRGSAIAEPTSPWKPTRRGTTSWPSFLLVWCERAGMAPSRGAVGFFHTGQEQFQLGERRLWQTARMV